LHLLRTPAILFVSQPRAYYSYLYPDLGLRVALYIRYATRFRNDSSQGAVYSGLQRVEYLLHLPRARPILDLTRQTAVLGDALVETAKGTT
jgi:hypothetical protein